MFPSADAIYDGFVFTAGSARSAAVTDLSQGVDAAVEVPPGADVPIGIAYTSRGLGDWAYAFAREGVSPVRDFSLVMKTDFEDVDFPAGTMSPTSKARDEAGWSLTWKFASLVTGQRIGMDLPDRMNPGPLAARITWFAPVSLLFFLAVMVILGVLRGHSLHPMNYAFVSAAFFAFHLLLAYLVDHLDIHLSFAIAAVTSVALVVSYLRLVAGTRFALREAGLAQLVFLVFFSYAFFFEGYTGLTVTVGAIVTLFALMQMTARVDWGAVFARRTAR
jgi:inner membrane protein involved in colicin E2 resistance